MTEIPTPIRFAALKYGWALATATLSDLPVYHAHTTDKGTQPRS